MAVDSFRLNDEVALITGGGTGIGFAVAQCFVEAGARVVLVGRREHTLSEACDQIGNAASFIVHDVTNHDRAGDLLSQVRQAAGPVSILVNNAGMHLKKPAVETSNREFHTILDTHVLAAHSLACAALPNMIERKHGNILFMASMASLIGVPLVVAYSAAKSAYLGMLRTLAAEVSKDGVRVNGIAPGWIDTLMLRNALDGDNERRDKILRRTPMGRFGEPLDVGRAATFLCSPAAKFITGVVLPVDGGASTGF